MLLVAEAVVFLRKLSRTTPVRHQRYWSISRAAGVEQIVRLLRPGWSGCTARRPTWRCAAWRRGGWRDAADRHAFARTVSGVVTGAPVTVGIQVVWVARVAVEHGLRRFLGAEACAVVLVGLRHGRLARIDHLLVGDTQDETGYEHQPHHYQLRHYISHPVAHCTPPCMQTIHSLKGACRCAFHAVRPTGAEMLTC